MELTEKTTPAEGDETSATCSAQLLESKSGEKGGTSTPTGDGYFIRYRVNQIPPIPVALAVAFQHMLVNMASALTIATIVGDSVCVDPGDPLRARLMTTTLFMSGLSTVLQSSLGIRLGVFQGASGAFVVPLTVLKNGEWICSDSGTKDVSNTTNSSFNMDSLSPEEKLQQLSGSLMAASLLEMMIGGLGLTGFLLRYIGPLTVAPTVTLIGLSLYKLPAGFAFHNPPMALGSLALVLMFTLYLSKIEIPLPCKNERGGRARFPVFQVLSILLAILVSWLLCYIFTVTDVFPNDPTHRYYLSRTDAKKTIISGTPWILVPYPGQFGRPSFNLAAFVGFITAFMSSSVESVGDYFGSSRASRVMPPPNHAINRGILVEGVCGFLAGAVGAAHATTSYSQNVGLIRLTRTASRWVVTGAGVLLLLLSLIGKLGATMATLPSPILAATFMVMMGMVAIIGLSYLECVDMSSDRNLVILGTSLMSGLSVPHFVQTYPGLLATGDANTDQLIRVFLGTPMLLGGLIAFFLDNTVPGTDKERGIKVWRKHLYGNDAKEPEAKEAEAAHGMQVTGDGANFPQAAVRSSELSEDEVYSFMCLKGRCKSSVLRFIPFLPSNMAAHDPQPTGSQETVDFVNII